MIIDAIKRGNIEPKNSVLIGDSLSDIYAGFKGGIPKRYYVNKKIIYDKLITKSFKNIFECAVYLKEGFETF